MVIPMNVRREFPGSGGTFSVHKKKRIRTGFVRLSECACSCCFFLSGTGSFPDRSRRLFFFQAGSFPGRSVTDSPGWKGNGFPSDHPGSVALFHQRRLPVERDAVAKYGFVTRVDAFCVFPFPDLLQGFLTVSFHLILGG